MCSWSDWSHRAKTLLCRESIVLTASLPTLGRLWSEKAIRMCYWLIFLLGPSFHFSYRAMGNRRVKQQTCRYFGFKREKSRSLFILSPKPPFYTKGLAHSTGGGLLYDWQAAVFFIISIPFVKKVILAILKRKKVRFWVDGWSWEPIISVSVKI